MGYILTDKGIQLQEMVRRFSEKEIAPYVAEYDRNGEFPVRIMEKVYEMGLHCLEVPEQYGGAGIDLLTAGALYEEVAKVDAGVATTLGAASLALKPVFIAGNEQQKKLVTDLIISGGIGSFCLTEADAGSDAVKTRTTAVREDEEYVINGAKCFITNAKYASFYVVFATIDKSKGLKGISAFIVEATCPGISIGKEEDKMGIRLSNTAEVVFENVRIPADHLLSKEGDGFKIAMKTLDKARPCSGAIAVGIAQHALDASIAYSKQRNAFGGMIADLQSIQFMLADMDIKVETARQMVAHAQLMAESGRPYSREAAIAKCYAGDIAMSVTTDAVQIFGGYGYSREYPVEKLMRDAKIFQIFEGTNQIQRVVIAGSILR